MPRSVLPSCRICRDAKKITLGHGRDKIIASCPKCNPATEPAR